MTYEFLSLAAPKGHDVAQSGGKAAGLAEALRQGAPVPPGLVIGQGVFTTLLAHNQLGDEFLSLLEAAAHEASDLPERAERFAEQLLATAWPKHLDAQLGPLLDKLPAGPLVVRSSPTLEDTDTGASAGLFHAELGVDRMELRLAVRRCWAAAFHPEVFHQLLAFGKDPRQLRVPLLVQAMVQPRLTGVCFTTDPDDPERQTMHLAVSEGQTETSSYHPVPKQGPVASAGALDARAVTQLRQVAIKLEKASGRALELDWAFENGKLWMMQARPITSLPPGAHARPAVRWSRQAAQAQFPDPISPLGWTVLQSALPANLAALERRFGLKGLQPDQVATVISGYVYHNPEFWQQAQALYRPEGRASQSGLGRWGRGRRDQQVSELGSGPNDSRLKAIARRFESTIFLPARDLEAQWKREFPRHLQAMEQLDGEDVTIMPTPELLRFARRVLDRYEVSLDQGLAIEAIQRACCWAIEELGALVDGAKHPERLATLIGGQDRQASQAMQVALERLHRSVADDRHLADVLRHGKAGALAAAWESSPATEARQAFLREFGHLSLSWDLRQATLRDRPFLLDDLLAQRLRAHVVHDAEQHTAALAERREAETARFNAALASAPHARTFFQEALTALHTAMRLGEEHHLHGGRLIPAGRRFLAELAKRLVAAGVFSDPDDIYFLRISEVFALGEELAKGQTPHGRQRLIARRRAAFERAIAQPPIEGPSSIESTPGDVADGQLQGQPLGDGQAEGLVRVVTSMKDMAAFRPGEVLVVPTVLPGHAPLFAVAAALVAARGGVLSHGLLAAQAFGLPVVGEADEALDRLQTGQRVRVDGRTGLITVLSQVAVAH